MKKFCLCLMGWLAGVGVANAAENDADPAKELASFQVAAGFEVNLFASEKEGVVKPIQIRFDARGRIWVIGSVVYPQLEPSQKPDDKVLILEDADGDGRCDKATEFADGLMIPTGIELGNGGVYVGHGTELLFLKDTDGDDRADGRDVVLRGFGTGDNHQNINSFMFGPGGEMWMCQGLHTHSNVETPWGIVRMNKAGLWRYRPLLKKLEGFYGSEHEPQNPWGYVFTKWGEPIVIAGNNSSIIYPVPGLTSSHKDLAPHLIWKSGQGRKSSGADIVETAHFPDEWQGVLITGGYINNAVWALKILEDGSGFAIEDLPPMIRSTDRSFRPVDVKFGPDGALYICDWYNPIIGHYQASFRHPERDKKHGRIWRVTAKGRALTKKPKLAQASEKELLGMLDAKDGWTRKFAKRVLSERPREKVVGAVTEWSKGDLSDLALKEGLGVLQSHEVVDEELLRRVGDCKEPGARAYAAGVAGLWADRLKEPLGVLGKLAEDENARVRLQAVGAASYVKGPGAIKVVFQALEKPTDKFLNYALQQTIYALKGEWLPALTRGDLANEKPEHLTFLVKADGTADTVEAVRELAFSSRLDESTRRSLLVTLAGTGSAADIKEILQSSRLVDARVLKAIGEAARVRNVRPEGVSGLLSEIVKNSKGEVLAAGLELAGIWRITELKDEVYRAAANGREELAVRKAAIDATAWYGGPESEMRLASLAAGREGEAGGWAVAALTRLNLSAATEAASRLAADKAEKANWEEIFGAFLQKKGGGAALAKEFSKNKPSRGIAETGIRLMNMTGRTDEALLDVLKGIAGESKGDWKQRVSPSFFTEIREKGNARRGGEIYRRVELGCVNCHLVYGEGGKIGPDLSALGTAQPIDFIVGAILEPQKEVKEGFNSVSVMTKSEDEFQGYVVRENASEVVLRDVLKGKEVTIPRREISSLRQSGSVMPAGLADGLSEDEFRDLVKYLSELGRPNAGK